MGNPGKNWNVELTSQNLPPCRMMDGSGAKPGMMGLTVLLMGFVVVPLPLPLLPLPAMVEGDATGVRRVCCGGVTMLADADAGALLYMV